MKKKILAVVLILIIIITTFVIAFMNKEKTELKSIKNAKELEKFYDGDYEDIEAVNNIKFILGMPFSLLRLNSYKYYGGKDFVLDRDINSAMLDVVTDSAQFMTNETSGTKAESTTTAKDYSTTNIQVENVDEADITKTDGDYIYSLSDSNVVITNVQNPEKIEISSKIAISDNSIPEDLILYKDKLVVICAKSTSRYSNSYYSKYNTDTIVKIYNIQNKEKPTLEKSYTLYEPYYTSRCIDGKLYVISSGNLRKENDEIITYYDEDCEQKIIDYKNIKYFDEIKTNKQTLISMLDLNNAKENVNVSSYLIDVSNAYVSENNIYLLNQKYGNRNYQDNSVPPISSLFGLWGAIGPFIYEEEYYDKYDRNYYTDIYKFNILEDGQIKYACKANVKGKTINQYSVDEYDNTLRLALYTYEGSRITILDEKLNVIGETPYLAKGENMYSSRFMGNKAYLVTYQTIDPLFVIDLSDSRKPKVLGELKIPGYSTYLHPYDENHIIGIGMETKETVNRNSSGKVTSTTARIVGMKMALFDVSDVNNPVELSHVVIGDSRATSAILTNPKALLFSKEKELIAIPVNNYKEDFEVSNSTDTSTVINSYINYNKNYVSEGYLVYKINLKDGINLKGIITHTKEKNRYGYSYITNSKLLRGMYIDNNLFTVSEDYVKVNNLDTLEEVSKIGITEEAKKQIKQETIGIEETKKEIVTIN